MQTAVGKDDPGRWMWHSQYTLSMPVHNDKWLVHTTHQGSWALGEYACLVPAPELYLGSSQIAEKCTNVRRPPNPPEEPGVYNSAHWHGDRFTCTDCSACNEREKIYKNNPVPELQWPVRNTALPLKETLLKPLGVMTNPPACWAELNRSPLSDPPQGETTEKKSTSLQDPSQAAKHYQLSHFVASMRQESDHSLRPPYKIKWN